jgi:hypothetical protein
MRTFSRLTLRQLEWAFVLAATPLRLMRCARPCPNQSRELSHRTDRHVREHARPSLMVGPGSSYRDMLRTRWPSKRSPKRHAFSCTEPWFAALLHMGLTPDRTDQAFMRLLRSGPRVYPTPPSAGASNATEFREKLWSHSMPRASGLSWQHGPSRSQPTVCVRFAVQVRFLHKAGR